MPAKFEHRVRKQKAKARLAVLPDKNASTDSNAAEIVPSVHEQQKAKLRAELRAQQPLSTISSKKAKRLDHYIETKLKKEENLELIKKLASQKVDTSLLRSAKNLGRGTDTRRETLHRALQETDRGVNVERNADVLYERRQPVLHDLPADTAESDLTVSDPVVTEVPAVEVGASFGSGLKRPLHIGEDGKPQIKKRKRRKVAHVIHGRAEDSDLKEADSIADSRSGDSDGWAGFSDEDAAYDGATDDGFIGEGDSLGDSGSSSGGSDEESTSSASEPLEGGQRSSMFKEWAEQQRNKTLGFVPTSEADLGLAQDVSHSATLKRQASRPAVNAPALAPFDPASTTPVMSVMVKRTAEVQEARMKLPVVQEEQRIMEAIHANSITIVCGATGSGKTTQVPQMMFESGYGSRIGSSVTTDSRPSKGMIGVTQPRRVAATSVAERVTVEMGDMRNRVGHQVRFDSAVGPSTAIKFMTDGILLREIANDFTLSKYSAIVIDEAHERSTNTDILIGLLSRIVELRHDLAQEKPNDMYPLKLVVMSATMRVEDFTQNAILFRHGPPPIIQAEGRQFPVINHFARRTRRDYLEEMFLKVKRGHNKLPKGGMLVFLTGQAEILALKARLERELPSTSAADAGRGRDDTYNEDMSDDVMNTKKAPFGYEEDDHRGQIHGLSDDDEEEETEDEEFKIEDDHDVEAGQRVHVLPLYSQLPASQQSKVFQPPPEGARLIVLATNVAETSLTIPEIRYVFDCGRAKEKQYDTKTGVQTFEVNWISKASAAQRAGRAGRTGPGHCYRLYSSAVYERDFQEYSVPEILRSPVENVALLVKGVDFPNVANFPFPTPPDRHALAKAEDLLRYLGAIDVAGKITPIGRTLANYPLSPRYGRMLLLASSHGLLAHTIALVSALAIPELLMSESMVAPKTSRMSQDGKFEDSDEDSIRQQADIVASSESDERLKAFKRAQNALSRWDSRTDAFKLLMAFVLCRSSSTLAQRCEEFFVREKGMTEALDLRTQLVRIVQSQQPQLTTESLTALPVLKDDGRAKLRYILAAGFADQVAIRADLLPSLPAATNRKPRRATEVPYRTLLPSSETLLVSRDKQEDKNVYVHPSSVLARLAVPDMPQFIVYSHLSRPAIKVVSDKPLSVKVRMHPLTTVGATQLVALAEGTPLLELGKPIGMVKVLPRDDSGRERREVWVGLSLKGKEGARWDVGNRKERQIRTKEGWITERVIG